MKKNIYQNVVCSCLCVLFVLSAIGCGQSEQALKRRVVKGTVTVKGDPLLAGEIRFVPAGSGPVSVGVVVDGLYEVTSKGGVPLGEMRVEIRATSLMAEGSLEEMEKRSGNSTEIVIADKYNKKSQLQLIVEAGTDFQSADFPLE